MKLNPFAKSFEPGAAAKVAQQAPQLLEPFPLLDLPSECISTVLSHLGSVRDVLSCAAASKVLQAHVGSTELRLGQAAWPHSAARAPPAAVLCSLRRYMPGLRSLSPGVLLEDGDLAALVGCSTVHGGGGGAWGGGGAAVACAGPGHAPRLRVLDLQGGWACSKLTDRLPAALAAGGTGGLAALNMQRCFQLTAAALTHLLRAAAAAAGGRAPAAEPAAEAGQTACSDGAAAAAGSLAPAVRVSPGGLRSVALSHLDLAGWVWRPRGSGRSGTSSFTSGSGSGPASSQAACDTGEPSESGEEQEEEEGEEEGARCELRLRSLSLEARLLSAQPPVSRLACLALHNCSGLSARVLAGLCRACPQLQLLLLGGSCFASGAAAQASSLALALEGGAGDGSGSGGGNGAGPGAIGSEYLAARCTAEAVLGLGTGSPAAAAGAAAGDEASQAAGEASSRPLPAYRAAHAAHAAAVLAAALSAGADLAAAALCLPRLRVLELTFFAPEAVAAVRRVLAAEAPGAAFSVSCTDASATSITTTASASARAEVGVWDLSVPGGVEPAAALHRAACAATADADAAGGGVGAALGGTGEQPGPLGPGLDPELVRLALKCAANCSNAGRRLSPLHFAAHRGDARAVSALLGLGATPDARDVKGATPLFLAAEAGHAGCCQALLAGGAAGRVSNSAGEAPMYIAALRGHLGVVRALLAHFGSAGVEWQRPELYGDAWTPLMAAAVANRADVAALLLAAAGPAGGAALVAAVNRYQQSVLHIGARKGSVDLLRTLLGACRAEAAAVPDLDGLTPHDVAALHANAAWADALALVHGQGHGHGQRSWGQQQQRMAAAAGC